MNKNSRKNLTVKLLLITLFSLTAGLSQPAGAYAQTAPTGTGKTLGAVLLGTQEPINEFPWQISLQAHDAEPKSVAKVPGMHKVSDVTLKRG